MKVLIAVVMFLFGLFVGILVMPMFNEFSSTMYVEEEYSTPRIKTILHGFGITLPLEASEINMFLKQDGQDKQVWVKFGCSPEVRDALVAKLRASHSGHFNHEIVSPKMMDGTPVTWWTYSTNFPYYEFRDMGAAYDEVLQNFYIYAAAFGSEPEPSMITELEAD